LRTALGNPRRRGQTNSHSSGKQYARQTQIKQDGVFAQETARNLKRPSTRRASRQQEDAGCQQRRSDQNAGEQEQEERTHKGSLS